MADTEPMDVESLIAESDEWISDVLSRVGWTREHLLAVCTDCHTRETVTCPVDSGHVMSAESIHRHVECCRLVARGYTRQELAQDQSSKFFYEKASTVFSIDLDEQTICNLLVSAGVAPPREFPMTLQRSLQEESVAQRRAIYDYCIEVSRIAVLACKSRVSDDDDLLLLSGMNKGSGEEKPQSKLEQMAQMRDLKRRRQSYKGKSTHTNKKSYNEVMREVIINQMEVLASIWEDERRERDAKLRLALRQREGSEERRRRDGEERRSGTRAGSRERHSRERGEAKRRHRSRSRESHRSKEGRRSRSKEGHRSKSRERHRSKEVRRSRRSSSREGHRSRSKEEQRSWSNKERADNTCHKWRHGSESKNRESDSRQHRASKNRDGNKSRNRDQESDEDYRKRAQCRERKEGVRPVVRSGVSCVRNQLDWEPATLQSADTSYNPVSPTGD